MPSLRSVRPWAVVALAAGVTSAVGSAGCRQETILLAPRADTTHTGGTGGGTVQRVPLTLTIKLFPNDTGMGIALGWPSGVVPGAAVTLQRDGTSDTTLHAISDSLGKITFPSILTGSYSISALRVVDSTERPRLPAGYRDVDALGSGGRVGVDTPSVVTNFTLPVSHRGSLLVSEFWSPLNADPLPNSIYPFAGFVELYNNSDTTIYLDGLIFGDGLLANPYIYPGSANSCTNFADMMGDTTGVWAEMLFRFPGSGHDHPISPGQAVVIATDAVDHRVVNPDASDLTNADFEFIGPSDVDNPAVPNMINLGTREATFGHGWYAIDRGAPFVALPLSVDTLPKRVIYTDYLTYYHVARSAILGLSLFLMPLPTRDYCRPLVTPSLDAAPAFLPYVDYYSPSMQRRVLRRLPDGRAVLQNTRTSVNDFVLTTPRTPGSVP